MKTLDPFRHHRRSIRLKDYDYSQAGAYFVTICAQNRECLFGEVAPGAELRLNDAGDMIARWWDELSNKYPAFCPDAFVVMPNHIHCIVVIADAGGQPPVEEGQLPFGYARGRLRVAPTYDAAPLTLGDMIDWFKTMATNEYIRGVKQRGWKPFNKKLLQRNYYEHIIPNERELNAVRE